jgi:hypothetical protein
MADGTRERGGLPAGVAPPSGEPVAGDGPQSGDSADGDAHGVWAAEPSRPDDPGRWNVHSHQPYSGYTPLQRLWMSRGDALDLARMAARSLPHARAAYRAYRRLLREPVPPQPVGTHRIAVGITPTAESIDRCASAVEELGVRSLLVRVPSWNPEPVLALADRFGELRRAGFSFIFSLVQDRRAALDPASWTPFVNEACGRFAGLEPTFQLGQAINRKKWGLWHPDEYLRLMEATAAAHEAFPTCKWIGPPVIDFEYHYTLYYLFASRPFDFDGVTSLLYVDRRGSPDSAQFGHFDLQRKILLLRAMIAASPHRHVPVYLTEFNWSLLGSGAHSPTGPAVQIDELRQARYLIIYYLTALASADVAAVSWWQLFANGYGLCQEDSPWRRRPSFAALQTLVRRTAGATVARLAPRRDGLRGFVIAGVRGASLALYATRRPVRLPLPKKPDEAVDLTGLPLNLGEGEATLGASPAYLMFDGASADEALAAYRLV